MRRPNFYALLILWLILVSVTCIFFQNLILDRFSCSSTIRIPKQIRTLHLIYCLSGNKTLFIDEWETSFKSVLVNNPIDSNLQIHLIVDKKAADAIDERIRLSDLTGVTSRWRNQVSVILHNIEELIPSWKQFFSDKLTNESNRNWLDRGKTGFGTYFRLLAHRIIVPYVCYNGSTNHIRGNGTTSFRSYDMNTYCTDSDKQNLQEALYMDTDVVIMANLNHLMQTAGDVIEKAKRDGKGRPLWIWNYNAGFIVMDLLKFENIWKLAATIPSNIRDDESKEKHDQWFLGKLHSSFTHLNISSIMPDEWSTHVGHGFRRFPQKLFSARKNGTGILHFTAPKHFGGNFMDLGGTDKWCKFSPKCNHTDIGLGGDMDKVRSTWGLAEYYTKLSWDWAKYQGGISRLSPGDNGRELRYSIRVYPPPEEANV